MPAGKRKQQSIAMSKFLASLSLLALGLAAAASPLGRREDVPGCFQWSFIGFSTAPNFTLAAYNTSDLLSDNPIGAPLVLGQAGAIAGDEFHVLSTYASYPYDQDQTWSLQKGALLPNNQTAAVAGGPVADGTEPSWITGLDAGVSAQIWCAVPSTSAHGGGTGYPALAVNGDINSFALCKTGDSPLAQNNVVYKPSPDSYSYLFDTCYNVTVQIVETY
ncbi:hypothetical protein BDW22DRAFT_1432766 [Trametopsis cervina]|nr:hypothetical protein BDW22DRAFT_1432766 [Trametopsis cervina]